MQQGLFKLPPNRVRRNYRGGAGIDLLHGIEKGMDNDCPEEWIGSMVEAVNPGLSLIPGEGLSVVETLVGQRYLRDIVDEDKVFYLGEDVRPDGSWQLSFLFKILDSAMRLHVQAHPSSEFANRVLKKPYGKLECYYILGVREGQDPYIRLGFQHAPSRWEWKRIMEEQDISAMDACFEKIPVAMGEVWYIPGGMPHAIGEGITLLEIMEPSDLVVRCEYEREGIVVPPLARLMGQSLDFCLDIFDYREYTVAEIRSRCNIPPKVVEETERLTKYELVGESLTGCFTVEQYLVRQKTNILHVPKFTLGVICEGACELQTDDERLLLRRGDSFVIAAGIKSYNIVPYGDITSIVEVIPGKEMKKARTIHGQ